MSPDRHPDTLPWFAAGTLDTAEAETVEAHLRDCPACRDEVERLVSMQRSVARQDRDGHVPAATLVAYAEGRAIESLESHLEHCDACREDLAELRAAAGDSPAPLREAARATATRGQLRFRLAASLAAVLAVTVGALLWLDREPAPASLSAPTRVILLPIQRSPGAEQVLVGAGPWLLEVALPSSISDGRFTVHIESPGGEVIEGSARSVDNEGGALFLVVSRLEVGIYDLVLHSAEPAGQPHTYPFRVRQ